MGCTPICYDNGKRKQPIVNNNKVGDNSQNKNLNKNLNTLFYIVMKKFISKIQLLLVVKLIKKKMIKLI